MLPLILPPPFVDPQDVPESMRQLGEDLSETVKSIVEDPKDAVAIVERAANIHWRLGQIHPFADGNGRLARLTTDVIFMSVGLVQIPRWTDTESTGKTEYYTAIRDSQIEQSNRPLAVFLAAREFEALKTESLYISRNRIALRRSQKTSDWGRREATKEALAQYVHD